MQPPDPPIDLSRERDELLAGFRKGTQLTQDLLVAYEGLRRRVDELERENRRLRNAEGGAAPEAPEAPESVVPVESTAARAELELELERYASLHVASNCIHSTLHPRGVGRRIKEVLEQLVGVETYAIFLGRPEPTPIVFEGLRPEDEPSQLPIERCAEVMHSGESQISDDSDPSQGTIDRPFALIPLCIDDKVVGVLAIVRSLPHKTQLGTVDFELFKLLGQHAAAALMAAGLYVAAGRQLPSADAFSSLKP